MLFLIIEGVDGPEVHLSKCRAYSSLSGRTRARSPNRSARECGVVVVQASGERDEDLLPPEGRAGAEQEKGSHEGVTRRVSQLA